MKKEESIQRERAKSRDHKRVGAELDFLSREAYNLLRTNLSFALPDKEGGKIIGVTSSNPQEGKSFTSINLAYSLAEAGHRVILIDADMRRPSVNAVLETPGAPGLSNMLSGGDDACIHKGVLHEGLSVLFSGDIPPNPAELIGSARMKKLLATLAGQYDYVIVDLPPVNCVSDPLAISGGLDGIVMVLRHRKTRRAEVREAVNQLKYAGIRILGIVYNGYTRSSGVYARRGGKYYGSYGATER